MIAVWRRQNPTTIKLPSEERKKLPGAVAPQTLRATVLEIFREAQFKRRK